MKHIIFLGALISLVLPTLAESLPLEGQPYRPSEVEIEWRVASNTLPKRIWVYKVVPQVFSGAVVSNAMAVGSFQPRHMINPRDKNLIHFQDVKPYPTRYLKIAPAAGWMTYYDSHAKMPIGEPIEGVPGEREVERLAKEYLFQLGIDRSQIVAKRGYAGDERKSRLAADGSEVDVEVMAREISFVRQVDGIPFFGKGNRGGFWIQFGNNGKVAGFDLLWRNLLPHELRRTASADEIITAIKQGKSVAPNPKDWSHAKKITITEITPYYLGTSWEIPQEHVYPIGVLSGTAETDGSLVVFELLSPVLSDASK